MAIIRNISYLFSAQVINLAIAFLSSIYITRLLGAEGRGMYALFNNALGLSALFFGFSVTATIVYLINSRKIPLENLLTSLLIFTLVSTGLVLLTLFVLRSVGLLHLVLPIGYQSSTYVAAFGLLHFNTLSSSILAVILNAYKRFKVSSFLSMVPTSLSLVAYTVAYYAYFGENDGTPAAFRFVVLVLLAVSLVNVIGVVTAFATDIKVRPGRKLIARTEIALVMKFSFLAYVGNLLQFLSYRLDFWFVDYYSGKQHLGVYSLAAQLAQLVWALPTAIAGILYSYAASADVDNARRYAGTLTTTTFVASALIIFVELVFLNFSLTAIYGAEFDGAISVIALLAIGTVLLSPAMVVASYFASQGKYVINLYGSLVGTLSCLILYPILIRNYNLYGAAIASTLAYGLNASVLFYFAKKERIDFFDAAWSDMRAKLREALRAIR